MKLLIKGGRVLDPAGGVDEPMDVSVDHGVIAAMQADLPVGDADVIDARGCVVMPGLIDGYARLGEPGHEHRETIASGTRAAARGGFTGVVALPDTDPVIDDPAQVGLVLEKARRAWGSRGESAPYTREGPETPRKSPSGVRVYPVGALTVGLQGEELTEMAALRDAGAVALSEAGRTIMRSGLWRRCLEYAAMVGLPVLADCQDEDLAGGGMMHEGDASLALGLRGIPAQAEDVVVARDLLLAESTGVRLHFARVTTARSVVMIRAAKSRGVAVTAGVTPHHLCLTDTAVSQYDPNTKVFPPLRASADVAALREGLRDGTVDMIVSDHQPHALEEKEVEFDYAAPGIAGLETALSLVVTELVDSGVLTLGQAVEKLSSAPARILGVSGGRLSVGAAADLTILDPEATVVVDADTFASRARNTPFHGRELRGRVTTTIVGGRPVVREGELTA